MRGRFNLNPSSNNDIDKRRKKVINAFFALIGVNVTSGSSPRITGILYNFAGVAADTPKAGR